MKSLFTTIQELESTKMNIKLAKSILNTNNRKRCRVSKSKVYEYYLIEMYFRHKKINDKELKDKLFDKIHYYFQNRYSRNDKRLSLFDSLRLEQWYIMMRYKKFRACPEKRKFDNCDKMEDMLRKHSLELHRIIEPLTKDGLFEYIKEVLNMIDEIKSSLNFFLT